jgi:ATP-dependent DNA ligase
MPSTAPWCVERVLTASSTPVLHHRPISHPCGSNWIHEIKQDGFRMMARRYPVGMQLLTRNGHDWSPRCPLIVEAVNTLKVRACLIEASGAYCRSGYRLQRLRGECYPS